MISRSQAPALGEVPASPAELASRFDEALARGDARAIAALYSPAAVVTLAEGRAAVGRVAIEAAFTAALAEGIDLRVGEQCEPLVVADQAITSHLDADGEVHTQIAQRVDGGYLWVLDGTRLASLRHP